jgi:hypothetical protein
MRHVYVVVRQDLPSHIQTVQACHAAICVARNRLIQDDEDHPSLVVLTVPDSASLIEMSCRLSKLGITHRTFLEADLDDQPTALATEPLAGKQRRVFADLPLLRGDQVAA